MKIKLTEKQYQKLLNEMRFDGKSTGLFSSEEPEESKPINEFGEKFKKGWSEFLSAAKREGKETAIAAKILKRLVYRKEVSEEEKKFLKNQSIDLLKIVGVVGLGVVSSVIPIALEKILNKKDMSIMPTKQELPKENPETGEDLTEGRKKKKKGNMNCRNCNWSWDIEEDDTDPSLCHKCGYNSELGKFDMGSLKKWEEDNDLDLTTL